MPVAFNSTSTSPSRGPSNCTSTISSGFLASNATAALVCMEFSNPKLSFPAKRCVQHREGKGIHSSPEEINRTSWIPFPSDDAGASSLAGDDEEPYLSTLLLSA